MSNNIYVTALLTAVRRIIFITAQPHLTKFRWIPVSREFEPHQRPPLFHWARNFTIIA